MTDYVVKHTDYVICIVFFILISIIKLGERKEMLHMMQSKWKRQKFTSMDLKFCFLLLSLS